MNGAEKKTTIGKLAYKMKNQNTNNDNDDISEINNDGRVVSVVPGDTYRAAAFEQLQEWSTRAGAIISHTTNKDDSNNVIGRPAATVVREGLQSSFALGSDVIIVDTSGRLHTDWRLMDDLKAVKEVIAEELQKINSNKHEIQMDTFLVLDGTTGMNMMIQATEFNAQIGVSGIVITKLDGTSKGGCVLNVSQALSIPIKFVGVGEKLEGKVDVL